MSKKYIFIVVMILILSSCSARNKKTNEKKWYDPYNVKTDTITLAMLRIAPDKDDVIEPIVEVTDKEKLNALKEGLKIELWEKVPRGDELKEEPMHYMILNNETMIVLYSGYGHCNIFNYKIEDGQYIKSDYSQRYIMNKDVFPLVEELIEGVNKETKSDG